MVRRRDSTGASRLRRWATVVSCFLASLLGVGLIPNVDAEIEGGPSIFGVVIGHPGGLGGRYCLTIVQALDPAVGFGLTRVEDFQCQMDYLWEPHILGATTYIRLPWYLGMGPVIQILDEDPEKTRNGLGFGAGFPIGPVIAMATVALRPSIQVAPGVQLFGYADLGIDVALGVRGYF